MDNQPEPTGADGMDMFSNEEGGNGGPEPSGTRDHGAYLRRIYGERYGKPEPSEPDADAEWAENEAEQAERGGRNVAAERYRRIAARLRAVQPVKIDAPQISPHPKP